MELTLVRFCMSEEMGTFGFITMPSGEKLYTVELPWRDNKPNVSCIPGGRYFCQHREFHRGGYPAIEVTGVPDRSLILLHVANTIRDLRGCIGVGQTLGFVDSCWAVLDSRRAFDRFMALANQHPRGFHLNVEQLDYLDTF